jgi:hypothetical protein
MKNFIPALFVLFVLGNARGQFVGLNSTGINRLKQLVKTDTDAARLFNGFTKKAFAALEESPNPRDTIVSEGHLSTHPDKIASVLAMQDFNKIYALALMYKMKGEKKYLDKAVSYLKAWARVNHPLGNPINDTKLDRVFEACDMLRTQLSDTDKITIDAWLTTMADAEMQTAKKGKATSMNNWHSHRLKVVGAIGYLLDIKKYRDYATKGLLMQIDTNLNRDGSSWDFMERDALHYHAYDLEPMLTLAIIIRRATGADDFNFVSPKGASIKKSVDWFLPYLTGEKPHGEYINSKVAFDLARAKNKEKGFDIGSNFDPANGLNTLSLAAYFDSIYVKTMQLIKQSKNDFADWQLVLNKLMK